MNALFVFLLSHVFVLLCIILLSFLLVLDFLLFLSFSRECEYRNSLIFTLFQSYFYTLYTLGYQPLYLSKNLCLVSFLKWAILNLVAIWEQSCGKCVLVVFLHYGAHLFAITCFPPTVNTNLKLHLLLPLLFQPDLALNLSDATSDLSSQHYFALTIFTNY